LARKDQILSECSPQCRHIEDRYSSLEGGWVTGTALDARTTAGIVETYTLFGRFSEGNSLQGRAAIGQVAPITFQMLAEGSSVQWMRLALAWVRGVRFRCMIKRSLFAAIFFAAPACQVSAQDANVSVDMIGIGSMSCAHWRSTQEHRLEGTIWIYGFWTGLNYVAAASDQPQAKIDPAAIVNEVEKTCAQLISQTLASAIWTTYLGSKR
jgi:hypothetical protein